jgi:HAD superfamily hydrolase (TIGR01548 family)
MLSLPVDAVLFDLDGTLVDESESYREALRRTAQLLLNEPVSAEEALAIKRHPGLNDDWDATWALMAQRRGGSPIPPTAEERCSPEYGRMKNVFQTYYLGSATWEELSGESPPFAWDEPLMARETTIVSRETLDGLRPFVLGIATSRPRAEALMALRQHALKPYFPLHAVIAKEDAPREKPDPAPLLELAARLDCRHPVYVGDTVNDALAAEAAGMRFIAVGPLAPDLDVQYRLRDVNDLSTLLTDLPARKGMKING